MVDTERIGAPRSCSLVCPTGLGRRGGDGKEDDVRGQTFVVKRKRLVPCDREVVRTESGALKKAQAMAGRMPSTAAPKVVACDCHDGVPGGAARSRSAVGALPLAEAGLAAPDQRAERGVRRRS
ncbi:hypothetical protein [Methylobacterium sp. WL6]|uniref:hypothetical protein n=1 Tax=Methylobacterium sp. WL6 TaxID=2603901 RepID=UPI00164FE6AE